MKKVGACADRSFMGLTVFLFACAVVGCGIYATAKGYGDVYKLGGIVQLLLGDRGLDLLGHPVVLGRPGRSGTSLHNLPALPH